MISHATNLEDVLLVRAFGHLPTGFWIDVGACHPLHGSLTKALSDRGWRGINVEPVPLLGVDFDAERPRDINLLTAVGAHKGDVVIHNIIDTCLTTTVRSLADQWSELPQNKLRVPLTTLRAICDEHVPSGQEIHFLTVDVEGAEALVLRGADWNRYRPWLVIVEATAPLTTIPTHAEWEPVLLAADYEFTLFDGCNRFYTAREHSEIRPALSFTADAYERALDVITRRALEEALIKARSSRGATS